MPIEVLSKSLCHQTPGPISSVWKTPLHNTHSQLQMCLSMVPTHTCFLFLSSTCLQIFLYAFQTCFVSHTHFIYDWIHHSDAKRHIDQNSIQIYTNSIGHNLILKSRPGRYTLHTNKYPHYAHSMPAKYTLRHPPRPLLPRWMLEVEIRMMCSQIIEELSKNGLAHRMGVYKRTYIYVISKWSKECIQNELHIYEYIDFK